MLQMREAESTMLLCSNKYLVDLISRSELMSGGQVIFGRQVMTN